MCWCWIKPRPRVTLQRRGRVGGAIRDAISISPLATGGDGDRVIRRRRLKNGRSLGWQCNVSCGDDADRRIDRSRDVGLVLEVDGNSHGARNGLIVLNARQKAPIACDLLSCSPKTHVHRRFFCCDAFGLALGGDRTCEHGPATDAGSLSDHWKIVTEDLRVRHREQSRACGCLLRAGRCGERSNCGTQ